MICYKRFYLARQRQYKKTKEGNIVKAEKTGYLHKEYEIFYLETTEYREFSYHYHEFYKILIFLRGKVEYFVEGKLYYLQPNDIVLIRPGDIHRPVLTSQEAYERIILYISPAFFDTWKKRGYSFLRPFDLVYEHDTNVLHLPQHEIMPFYDYIKTSLHKEEFANDLLTRSHFFQYMIHLNRLCDALLENQILPAGISNKKILDIISYINENISLPLDIDGIARHFYWSRSYLMHYFKKETGLTLGNYITDKRMYLAQKYLKEGGSVTDAWMRSGYQDYQTFYKAFKKKFKVSPSAYRK